MSQEDVSGTQVFVSTSDQIVCMDALSSYVPHKSEVSKFDIRNALIAKIRNTSEFCCIQGSDSLEELSRDELDTLVDALLNFCQQPRNFGTGHASHAQHLFEEAHDELEDRERVLS